MNDKLLKACENGDLNVVKELVQSNKYDSKIISGAKAVALFSAHFKILTYLQTVKN